MYINGASSKQKKLSIYMYGASSEKKILCIYMAPAQKRYGASSNQEKYGYVYILKHVYVYIWRSTDNSVL